MVTLRVCHAIMFTESHTHCVHLDSYASRTNCTADDKHSLLCNVHSSAFKVVPYKHLRNPLRAPDLNFKPRDSPRVQMFVWHALTSSTAQLVLHTKSLIVLRIWEHRATVAKSVCAQYFLASHDTRITPLYNNCNTQSNENNRSLLNPFPKLNLNLSLAVIFDRYCISSLFPVQKIEIKLPIVMSSLTDTQLFADVPTGLVTLFASREQPNSFPIIDVVIKWLNQKIFELIIDKYFVTFRELPLDAIMKFGPDLAVSTQQRFSIMTISRDALEFASSLA